MLGRMCFQKLLILLAFVLAASDAAVGATISVSEVPNSSRYTYVVTIKGTIEEGDAVKFDNLAGKLEKVLVVISGDGGKLDKSLAIGARISLKKFSTMVAPDGECYSSCGLIWLAGARRYMHPATSRIGFHASSKLDEKGNAQESGETNAIVGSYLTHLGLKVEAIRYITLAPPNKLLMLTPEGARKLGIEVFVLKDETATSSPRETPSLDTHARDFLAYSYLIGAKGCRDTLGIDEKFLDGQLESIWAKVLEITNKKEEVWNKARNKEIQVLKSETGNQSPLQKCLYFERRIRAAGLPSGIDGPSFPCIETKAADEMAVCKNADLWPMDRIVTSIFRRSYDFAKVSAVKVRLKSDHDQWLKKRGSCGDDQNCLKGVYEQRISKLIEMEK